MKDSKDNKHKDGKERLRNVSVCRRLLKKIADGDKSALCEFCRTFDKTIYIIARVCGCTHEDAEEVTDDLLVKVWNNAHKISTYKNPIGWIYTVVKNDAVSAVRKRSGEILTDETPAGDSGSDGIDECDARDGFFYMIKDLSDEEKQFMIMRFVHDMTFREIADEIGVPLSTLTTKYYEAIRKVREKMKRS